MDTSGTMIMPPGGSTMSGEIDAVFNLILYVGTFFFALVSGLAVYFVVKYRRKEKPGLTSGVDQNAMLELTWTVIPTLIVVVFFILGFRTFLKMNIVPRDALEIKVTAQRWLWTFDYPNGANSVNELVVPAGRPIRLTLSSNDVIHSFFVPDFRVKMDALPNRYTVAWFEAKGAGEHDLFCAEYCGKGHSEMLGRVRVVPQEEYDGWLERSFAFDESVPLEEHGAGLYRSKACFTCHSIDGTGSIGPTFMGAFGDEVILADGSKITADENYVRESILNPRAKLVIGYQPVMPTYQGKLKDREVDALVAYIKSLRD